MQTHLIEIVADVIPEDQEEGWAEWAAENVKEHGWKVAIGGFIAAPLAPTLGVLAVGAGVVSGVQHGVAWLRGSDTIEKVEISKSKNLRDEQGHLVELDRVYAIHPDEERSNLAISAADFHNIVVTEQITDLVSFIRGSVRASSIKIEVESEKGGSAGLGILSRLSLKSEGGTVKHHSVDLTYENPEIVPMEGKAYWLRLFPEIVTAFKAAQRGSIKRRVSVDTTFGLTASLAEQAGIDASWLGKQSFIVQADFA